MIQYAKGAERPSLQLWVLNDAGTLIDFSSGYTFTLKIGAPGSAAVVTKTTGITGAAGSGTAPTGTPNITVAWTAGELDIATGVYVLQMTATTGGLDRIYQTQLSIVDVIT